MKKPLIYLSLFVLLGACKKDKDDDNQEEEPDPTAARITVYNATQWSTTSPYGTATEAATVSLYATAAAYPGTPAYTGTTNANGEVVLDKLTPGEYFVVAEKEYLHEKVSNLLLFVKGLGGFYADSIYQSAPDAGQAPLSPFGTVAGNFRIADLNGDGVIDQNDRGEFPAVRIRITDQQETAQKVLIGHTDNRIFIRRSSASDLNLALTAAYAAIGRWHETAITLDAVYTDEYDCSQLSAPWCAVNTYQLTPTDQTVSKFWSDGYLLISGMGSLIANTELSSELNEIEKKTIIGQAKALKAYVYLQLSQYFGSLPLQEWLYLHPGAQRATQEATETYIEDLLKSAKTDLQAASLLVHKSKLSVSACNALLARLYLNQRKWQQAYDVSATVISQYSLDNGNNVFTQATSPEIIWAPAPLLFSNDVKQVFKKGTFSPDIRLPELLLINGEAAVELGLPAEARGRVNALRLRASLSEQTSSDLQVLKTAIHDEWKREMAREGFRLAALARWGAAVQELGQLGFIASDRYLPIPQRILDWHFNITQNVGYN